MASSLMDDMDDDDLPITNNTTTDGLFLFMDNDINDGGFLAKPKQQPNIFNPLDQFPYPNFNNNSVNVLNPYGYQQAQVQPLPFNFQPQPQFYQPVVQPPSQVNNVMNTQMPTPTPLSPHQPQLQPVVASIPPQPAAQPAQAQQSAQQMIASIYALYTEHEDKLRRILADQTQFLQQPQNDTYSTLVTVQRSVREQIDTELRALTQIYQQVILDATDLARLVILQQELRRQNKQLELYMMELQQFTQQQGAGQAALVITKQPFPLVITKGKQLAAGQLTVQLLTGAATSVAPIQPAKATLLCESHNPSTKGAAPSSLIESESQNLGGPTKSGDFQLKLVAGTRKAAVSVKFSVPVRTAMGSVTVESEMSSPFVVITNECQWEGSAGTLLKKDAFGGQLEIPWPQFVNTLQRHFLIATKQDLVKPKRALSMYDFNYINTQFFGCRMVVSHKDFDNFWLWFGKMMQTLKYQRHVCSMWQAGLIYGLINREDVNAALNHQEPGTFLTRFSERNPGQLGIAYVNSGGEINHYLVQPNDTAASKRTYPDFLGESLSFIHMLQLASTPTGQPSFIKAHKDVALAAFQSKKPPQPKGEGVYVNIKLN